ncbi:MAG TPA: hypothetical protein VIN05_08840 [Roseovarius sp.]
MTRLGLALCATVLAIPASAQSVAETINDYPTEARADYVFGCMAVNGQGQDTLRRCSCSIDRIASILPYEKYIEAETVLSLQQTGGERTAIFRTTRMAQDIVAELRRAQAEADILCF